MRLRACLWAGLALVASGCATLRAPPAVTAPAEPVATSLEQAAAMARRAGRLDDSSQRTRLWLDCALLARAWLDDAGADQEADDGSHARVEDRRLDQAIALAGQCSDQALLDAFAERPRDWSPGPARIADRDVEVRVEGASAMFRGAYAITPAQQVELPEGWNFRQPGFGLSIVLRTDRCSDDPRCVLYPEEGIHQWATAWIEPGRGGPPVLRIVDPARLPGIEIAGRPVRLSFDALAFYQLGASASRLPRQGIYGLLGGDAVGRRAGVYLLRDYDPQRVPVVMIHGLGSHPIIWSELSGAIWADPALRERYQVIHIVFQTNAPLLVSRLRVQGYLDRMWALLDPEGDDPARRKMVLIGHSLGGVVARLLTVDSGTALWDAAFAVPPERLPGPPEDVAGIRATFLLEPYPGACALVMLAAPHKGSPTASSLTGRLARVLVGRRAPEIQALKRLAREHPDAVRPEVAESYRFARLNSISTLQAMQPVRRAGESLLPVPGVRYHTIAGDLGGGRQGDGVVPLGSALLPGADSTVVVDSGHTLYREPQAIAHVLGVLHAEREQPCGREAAPGAAPPADATAAIR